MAVVGATSDAEKWDKLAKTSPVDESRVFLYRVASRSGFPPKCRREAVAVAVSDVRGN